MHSTTSLFLSILMAAYIYGCHGLTNPETSGRAADEFAGHPPGIAIFLPQNGGRFQAWMTFEYSLPGGGKFDKTVHMERTISGRQDDFIPSRFGSDSIECPYVPRLKKVCIDHGSSVHSCAKGCVHYSGENVATSGSTQWKQCLNDYYRSRSFWRSTCKVDAGVDILAYGESGHILVPSSIEHGRHCASPY